MNIKRLDHTNESEKKLIENYWLNITPGEIVDGKPVAEVVHFK